jgi:hypothetical protein
MRIHIVASFHAMSWQKTRLTRPTDASTNEQATVTTTPQEVCFSEVMSEVRGRERSGLDTGEAVDWRSDVPMDMAMEMAMVVTSITVDTAGATTVEPMKRNENRKRTRRSEALAIPSDWRSRIQRTV